MGAEIEVFWGHKASSTSPKPRHTRQRGTHRLHRAKAFAREKAQAIRFAAIHNGFGEPFPFELEVVQVDVVAFSWDEYCVKAGAADKKVNVAKASTCQGCPVAAAPAADHNATLEGFDRMKSRIGSLSKAQWGAGRRESLPLQRSRAKVPEGLAVQSWILHPLDQTAPLIFCLILSGG